MILFSFQAINTFVSKYLSLKSHVCGGRGGKEASHLRFYKVVVVLKLQLREEKWKN